MVMKVVKLNKLTLPPNTDGKAEEKEENKQEGEENGEKADDNEKDDKDKRDKDKDDLQLPQESPLKLLKYPNLMARSGVIFFNWYEQFDNLDIANTTRISSPIFRTYFARKRCTGGRTMCTDISKHIKG